MSDRDRATIEALKIALAQAADKLDTAATCVIDASRIERYRADVERYRAMSAEDWSALPVEMTGPSGAA